MRDLSVIAVSFTALITSLLWGCIDFDHCAPVSTGDLNALPLHLSATGLFAPGTDQLSAQLSADVRPYTPAFELWSDGAIKRRFILLPPGSRIDSADLDNWQFPRGTKLWKEFTRDGVRVETRLLQKTGDGEADWVGAAYVWNGADADLSIDGAMNARGTEHDVPAADRCFGCHAGRRSRVLGFSALQLSNGSGPLTLRDAADMLSQPATESLALPGSPTDQKVLGLLYANCSHCHNQERPRSDGPRCYEPQNDIDLSLNASTLDDISQTGLARTVIGRYIHPGDAAGSKLFQLYTHRGPPGVFGPSQMPPLATEKVDEVNAALLENWINALPHD